MSLVHVPDYMSACQIVEYNRPYKIQQVATPKIVNEHDMLVKVAVASICHTDLMVMQGLFGKQLPMTASHEAAGTVAAVGSAVTRFKEGDRVLVGVIYQRCGRCIDCQGPEKNQQYCPNQPGHLGVQLDGAFADYELVDSRECALIPDNLSFQSAAPLACAGATIWGGLIKANLVAGQWVGIFGSGGGLGHLGVQFAKALGLKVLGVDARDEALELTRKSGAALTVDARIGKKAIVELVRQSIGKDGVDATIVVSDASSATGLAAAVTKMHGLLVQIAQPNPVSLEFGDIIHRDVHIIGSLLCSSGELQKMVNLVAEHNINVSTHPVSGLKEIPKLLELVHSGKMAGKGIVLIDPGAH